MFGSIQSGYFRKYCNLQCHWNSYFPETFHGCVIVLLANDQYATATYLVNKFLEKLMVTVKNNQKSYSMQKMQHHEKFSLIATYQKKKATVQRRSIPSFFNVSKWVLMGNDFLDSRNICCNFFYLKLYNIEQSIQV